MHLSGSREADMKGFFRGVRNHRLMLWSVITAVTVLLFTTRSSVLFVCNNWDDANSYFTMGKGMMNGLVIYRDLYDQKGPFLYLMYGLAYLISRKTFLGVFLFEVIAASVFLYFSGKIIERRSSSFLAMILVPVLAAGCYSSWSFYFGGAAEEFCLPLFAYSMYLLDSLSYGSFDENKVLRIMRGTGLCAGVIAQVKYTMLGFFISLFLLATVLIANKNGVRCALRAVLGFILSALLPSVPWLIYFALTGSLDDWYRCYIYNNIFHYSQLTGEEYSFTYKLYEMSKTLYWLIRDSFSYFVWIITGFTLGLFTGKGLINKLSMPFMFACTYFFIFFGGNKLAYYSIPLMTFAIHGAACCGSLILILNRRIIKGLAHKSLFFLRIPACLSILILSTVFAAGHTMNAEFRGFDRDQVWLFEASEILSPDDTLLELNGVDAGLYTVTGIVPTCEYFQTNGIDLPEMFEEQKRYLKEGRTDYVVAADHEPEFIDINYNLISVYRYYETDHDQIYYLYKRKGQG